MHMPDTDVSQPRVKFYSGESVPLELHKVRIVQKLHLRPVEQRLQAMEAAGYNTFLLHTRDIFLDMLTVRFLLSYSTRPIHVFGVLGLIASGLGVLLGLVLTFEKLALGHNIGNRPLLLLAVVYLAIAGLIVLLFRWAENRIPARRA